MGTMTPNKHDRDYAETAGTIKGTLWDPAGRGLRIEFPGGASGRLVGTMNGADWIAYDSEGEEHYQEMCEYFDDRLAAASGPRRA
jgi:hypothetical protein